MFTGIIETTGIVEEVLVKGTNRTFWINSPLSGKLKVDQSVSHSGVCLTVEELEEGRHRVTAIDETLKKTALGQWKEGTRVNLERCLQVNGRLDGHFVQGHVDCTAHCIDRTEKDGSWEYEFDYPKKMGALLIEKGSICINGISLTLFNLRKKSFRVAVIPYTFEHTNIRDVHKKDIVNLEFDMIGKYINRIKTL